MFDRFRSAYRPTPGGQVPAPAWEGRLLVAVEGYDELMAGCSGCTFGDGVYRIHSAKSGQVGQQRADEAFIERPGRYSVFSFDWLGRQFALDFARLRDDEPLVAMLEPATGEALEIPATFVGFHEEELVDYADDALAHQFFEDWRASNPDEQPLSHGACVGFEVPLFLGGTDTVDNLEMVDFDVYWSLTTQMLASAAKLPRGTSIRGFSIEG